MKEIYLTLMNKRGWTVQQIDETDTHFFFELMEYQAELNDPAKQREKAWKNAKVVPIDHVF